MGFNLSSVVGNLTGGLLGTSDTEKAAKDANRVSAAAAKKGETEYNAAWGDIEGWLTPYVNAGTDALAMFKESIGVSPDTPVFNSFNFDYTQMENNPAYQFIKSQGLQAVDRAMAKNRNLGSGNRMTAIADYMGGLASTEYGNEWNRQFAENEYANKLKATKYGLDSDAYGRDMNNLSYLVGTGQNAATNMANLRNTKANSLYNTWAQRATDSAAASLLPAQEKQQFTNNLLSSLAFL